MIEIIRKGKIPEDKKFRYTCSRCQTIFEFKASEAKLEATCRNESFRVIKCPLCNRECCVDERTYRIDQEKLVSDYYNK